MSDESLEPALTRLQSLNDTGAVLFIRSLAHSDETLLAPRPLWDRIDDLSDELATGIELRGLEEIEMAEIHAAAGAFLGEEPSSSELWREAFRDDPHTPRDDLFFEAFGGKIRVRAKFEPDAWQIAEIEHEKAKEEGLTKVYEQLRAAGFSFDEIFEGNLAQMIRWKVPITDPEQFRLEMLRRYQAWASADESVDSALDAGSSYSRLMAFATRNTQMKHLLDRFPDLGPRISEFGQSAELRSMPTLAFPAALRAALASTPGRKAKPSDGYDIQHLTLGLSRADIVTADSGMTQLVRDFKLVPSECSVYSARELPAMVSALEERCG